MEDTKVYKIMTAFRVANNGVHQSLQITVVTKIYTSITKLHTLQSSPKPTNNLVHQSLHMTKNTKAYSLKELPHYDVH